MHSIETADLKLCMISLPEANALISSSSEPASASLLDPLTALLVDDKTVFVLNKTDLQPLSEEQRIAFADQLGTSQERCIGISLGGSEAGLSDLSDMLLEQIKERWVRAGISGSSRIELNL
jgi:tRNA U34 5-carboxymethylaminomethyl modifying GTPase MnmE/TrmE